MDAVECCRVLTAGLSTSADIESLEWTKIPRGGALNVRQEGKPTSVFVGFREQAREQWRA